MFLFSFFFLLIFSTTCAMEKESCILKVVTKKTVNKATQMQLMKIFSSKSLSKIDRNTYFALGMAHLQLAQEQFKLTPTIYSSQLREKRYNEIEQWCRKAIRAFELAYEQRFIFENESQQNGSALIMIEKAFEQIQKIETIKQTEYPKLIVELPVAH